MNQKLSKWFYFIIVILIGFSHCGKNNESLNPQNQCQMSSNTPAEEIISLNFIRFKVKPSDAASCISQYNFDHYIYIDANVTLKGKLFFLFQVQQVKHLILTQFYKEAPIKGIM